MTGLPRALEPWRRHLSIFPPGVASVIGEVIAKLSLLLGPHAAPRGSGIGMPDGVDGLSRRGLYERLLLSEWALAEEAPDEFLRRAAMAEHLYLDLARPAPAKSSRSLVFFDAGADQLGAPRLVHLASLVLFAQRAADSRMKFAWAVLQDETSSLYEEVTAHTVLALLGARSERRATPQDGSRWLHAMDDPSGTTELWLVGGPRSHQALPDRRPPRLEIHDSLDPENPSSVQVHVHIPQGRARSVTLPLPPDAMDVQLLRDPFRVAVASRRSTPERIEARSKFVFSPDGRKLFMRGSGGTLLIVTIPNSPRARTGAPVVFKPPAGHTIVAAGQARAKKRTLVVTQVYDTLFVHTLSKRGDAIYRSESFESVQGQHLDEATAGDRLAIFCALRPGYAFYRNGAGKLLRLSQGHVIDDRELAVSAVKQSYAKLSFIVADDPPEWRKIELNSRLATIEESTVRQLGSDASHKPIHFGPWACVAYPGSERVWTILQQSGGANKQVRVRDGDEVVGLLERGYPPRAYLVVVEGSRRSMGLVGKEVFERILHATAPVIHAQASDASPHIAYVTEAGELAVYSDAAKAIVLRLDLEPGT